MTKQEIKEVTIASDEFSWDTWNFIGNRPHREFIVTTDNSILVAVWTDIVEGIGFVHYSVVYKNESPVFTSKSFGVDDSPASSSEALAASVQFLNQ